ncbi:hypothetical protein BGZ54_000736, partial [Gamsiella multidivaricata]
MHCSRPSSPKGQRTGRNIVLNQLATSLGPAWATPPPQTSPTISPSSQVTHHPTPGHITAIASSRQLRRRRTQQTGLRLAAPPISISSRAIRLSHPGPSVEPSQALPLHARKRSRQDRRDEQRLRDAAHSSRLPAHGLSIDEFELLKHHLGRSDRESYLRVRNTMLWLWRESPKEPLTLARAFEATKNYGLHHGLVAHVFEFLLRSGYINFGGCAVQDDGIKQANPSRAEKQRTIIVIGSGISGIAVARQLENLFRHFAWRFAPELPPKVVVLEARSRIGGRIHTMELTTAAFSLPPFSQHHNGVHHHATSADSTPGNIATVSASGTATAIKRIPARHCVDLGAQIVTGFDDGNPMEVILHRQLSDLTLHYFVNKACDLFDANGKPVSKAMDARCEEVFNQILDQACQLREKNKLPARLEKYLLQRYPKDYKASRQVRSTMLPTLGHSMDYFMESHPEFKSWTQQELGLIHWHYANLEFANATTLDRLSLYHWDQDDGYEFSGPHCMVVQGYGQVPEALSQGLDIRLEMPVTRIKWSPSTCVKSSTRRHSRGREKEPVRIQCRDGTSLDCTIAAITVPLGVLKSQQIDFLPPLPPWKEQAVRHLGFGLLNKLVLVFEKPFWDPASDFFGCVGRGQEESYVNGHDLESYRSSRGKFYMFWSCAAVSGLPVLVALMAGQSAYDCERMPKEDLVQEALETLGLIHPHIHPIPNPIETIVTRWSQDEFAQGSYSFVGKEARGEDYDLLAKPIGDQLYFAGEATCRQYPATAHGAYLSGLKVAKEILDSLIGPQVIQSARREDIAATRTDFEGGDYNAVRPQSSKESDSGSDIQHPYGHSTEDTHYEERPLLQTATDLSCASLDHGFVVPRRRGKIASSLVADFAAELSDSDSDEA